MVLSQFNAQFLNKMFFKKHLLISFSISIVFITILLYMVVNGFKGVAGFNNDVTDQFQIEFSYNTELTTSNVNEAVQATFTPAKLNQVPVNFGDHFHWYKLSLTNPSSLTDQFRLIFDNPLIDKMTVYSKQDNQFKELFTFGDLQQDVSIDNRIFPSLAFDLNANQTKIFWLHLQTNGSPLVSINVMQESIFTEYVKFLHLIWGAFIAITLVMAIYNCVLFVGLRDRTYLYYVFYLLSVLMMTGMVHGFGYYLLPEKLQMLLSNSMAISQSLVSISALLFGAAFLSIDAASGAAFKVKQLALYLLIGFSFVSIFLKESTASPIFAALQMLTYVAAYLMLAYKIKSRFVWSRYYLISWLPVFIGAGVATLMYSGLIEYSFLTRHALLFAVIIEVALISTALADRMGALEKKRLFHATHDPKIGLANDYYLKQFLHNYTDAKNGGLTVVALKITNSEVIFPYIEQEKLKKLIVALSEQLINRLESFTQLLVINNELNIKSVIVNNEQLIFVLPVNKVDVVAYILSELSLIDNFNPLPKEIPFRLQCVIGARIIDNDNCKSYQIFNDLQQCLHHAQETKTKYCIYHDKMSDGSLRGVRLAHDLEYAISNDLLELYHQPQLEIHDDFEKTEYSEVLVRWNHPQLGFISPDEFVLIAEQTGLIKQLTHWVILNAFKQFKEIEATLNVKLNVSINVSANDFSRTGFYEEVAKLVDEEKVNPKYFTLEITETSQQDDTKCFHNNIDQLKHLGFKLAIDDFGTGYSSLTYISNLPFDELKIDRTFVMDLLSSDRQHQIVNATIQMAIKLGLSVTAEGIEDEETLIKLIELNCHKIQGYFYAKPMAFNDYKKWIENDEHYEVKHHFNINAQQTLGLTSIN